MANFTLRFFGHTSLLRRSLYIYSQPRALQHIKRQRRNFNLLSDLTDAEIKNHERLALRGVLGALCHGLWSGCAHHAEKAASLLLLLFARSLSALASSLVMYSPCGGTPESPCCPSDGLR